MCGVALQLAELGLLPEGDADPIAVSQQLAQMALSNSDADGLLAAQAPWTTAGNPAAALTAIGDLLRARPDMRATGDLHRALRVLQQNITLDNSHTTTAHCRGLMHACHMRHRHDGNAASYVAARQ
jgi:hypothetical protein